MDKSWTQLEARCKLFEDFDDYIPLLKDAECELASRCSLFKTKFTIYFDETSGDTPTVNAFKLPSNFKSIISVHIDGDLITQRDKSQWDFEDSSAQAMNVPSGTPDYYTIANGFIVFNKTTSTGYAEVNFRGTLPNIDTIAKTVQMIPNGDDFVYLDTTMGSAINGLKVQFQLGGVQLNTLENIVYDANYVGKNDIFNPSQNISKLTAETRIMNIEYQKFQGTDWDSAMGSTFNLTTGEILNYRSKGPVIDNDYHLALCDYAIYIATALTDPAISDKHRMLWEKCIKDTIDDNFDKELQFTMKEEI